MATRKGTLEACDQVGATIANICFFPALVSVLFGSALFALMPGSFEERATYLLFFGLLPALGFFVLRHLLRYMLGLSCKLCKIIAASMHRRLKQLAMDLLDHGRQPILSALDCCSMTLARGRLTGSLFIQKAYSSIQRKTRRAYLTIGDVFCSLIRITARAVMISQRLL